MAGLLDSVRTGFGRILVAWPAWQTDVKPSARRRYTLRRPRRAGRPRTRRAVLTAARELFAEKGYVATSIAAIAERAGVAVDTVYAAAGRKPAPAARAGRDDVVGHRPGRARRAARLRGPCPGGRDGPGEDRDLRGGGVRHRGPAWRPCTGPWRRPRRRPGCAALRAEISTRRATTCVCSPPDLRADRRLDRDLHRRARSADSRAGAVNAAEYRALLVDRERGLGGRARSAAGSPTRWTRLLLR